METAAVRVPPAWGVKVTVIVQLAPAATLAPQVLVCTKSPAFVPVMAMGEVNVRVADSSVLVSVTLCAALVVPTPWLANVKLGGTS